MSSFLSAQTGELQQSGMQLIQKAEDYKKLMGEVFQIIDELRNDWKGKDNEEFTRKLGEFRQPLEDLGKVINNYGEFLKQAGVLYAKTQDEIASQAGNING